MPENVAQPDPTDVPPYEGRTTGQSSEGLSKDLRGTVERQLAGTNPGNSGATSSPAEESPVGAGEVAPGAAGAGDQTATRADAATPGDVGTSTTRRGENVLEEDGESGRHRTGTQGESQRPVGESTARDSTGIDPQEPSEATLPTSGSSS